MMIRFAAPLFALLLVPVRPAEDG